MANGYCLLGEVHAVPRMALFIRKLPRTVRDILISLITGLFTRQSKAVSAVEPYCYEALSRFRWKSFGGQLPTAHSGIPGVERLGTNYVQRMWIFYNEIEDQKIQEETMWEGFKLTASAQSPKGVKKIDQRDRQRRQNEEQKRQALQDRFYYTQIGVLKPEVHAGLDENAPRLVGPKSVDELEDEMRRWVTGEEDWHDKIVNEYKRQVVQRYMQEKREREARLAVLRAQVEQGPLLAVPLVGYTMEQIQEILKFRQPGLPGVRQVFPGSHSDREYLYEKYLEKSPDSGLLEVQDGKLVPREGTGLTDQIAQRSVPFSVGPNKE
jgi:hypothetical protein